MEVSKSEVEKIPYMDGLRGVAALMVLAAHLMISLFPAVVTFMPSEVHTRFDMTIGESPFAFFWRGNFAVCIFFVISGYVLSEFCRKTKISFPAQVIRRYLRLAFPMLITSTFAWLLLSLNEFYNYKAAVQVTHSGWLSMWYQFDPHFFKMVKEAVYGAFVKGSAIYNCNLWTMRIELIGSVFVFMLHALVKNRILRIFSVIVLMFLYHENYFLLFLWGILLFDLKNEIHIFLHYLLPKASLRSSILIIGFIIGIYVGGFPELQPGMENHWYGWFTNSTNALAWHMLGAMLLVLFLLEWKGMQKILGSQIGKFLGKISFVLYLIHIPIICSLTSWVIYLTRHLPYYMTALISAVVTISAVITISNLLYRYVDSYTTSFSRWAGNIFDKLFQSELKPEFFFDKNKSEQWNVLEKNYK